MRNLPRGSSDTHESGICANQLWLLAFGFHDLHPLDQKKKKSVSTIFEKS